MIIESTKNAIIKRAKALASKKGRQEQGVHFIEGEKLVREAVVSGVVFEDAFIDEGHELMAAVLAGSGANVHTVKRHVMESITNTDTPQWVCATVRTPDMTPPESYPAGLIVVLDAVQDPGNLGTIIRTSDAMGASGVLLGDGCADPFAPKPIRASMGSVYHIPVWRSELAPELRKLSDDGFKLICTHLDGEETLPAVSEKCAVIIGNEGNGVADEYSAMCTLYRLPMYGFAESLNASVAAGIVIYELARAMRK